MIMERMPAFPITVASLKNEKIIEVKKIGIRREKNVSTVSSVGLNQCRLAIIIMYSFGSNLNAISKNI
jgi:hypothetical protein